MKLKKRKYQHKKKILKGEHPDTVHISSNYRKHWIHIKDINNPDESHNSRKLKK